MPHALISPATETAAAPVPPDRPIHLPGDWFLEFRQDHADGISVVKRGLEASPLVVRKYDIAPNEVLALTTHLGRRQAMTVFHFHPSFGVDGRRAYMEAHDEGRELAEEIARLADAQRGPRRAMIEDGLRKARRALAIAAQAAAVLILAHYSSGR